MNSETLVRSYYSKIIRLPSTRVVYSYFLFSLTISLITSLILRLPSLILTYALFSIGSYVSLLKYHKASLFISASIGILSSFFAYLNIPPIYAPIFSLPFMSFTSLTVSRELKAVFLSSLPSYISGLAEPKLIIIDYIYITTVFLIVYSYIWLINREGKKSTGFNSLEVVRPFLRSFTEKKSKFLEDFLWGISIYVDVPVFIIRFVTENDTIYLIVPKLHYGLYGEVGSSMFPYQVERYVRDGRILVFHGPGSHELDAATSKESEKVAQAIGKAISGDGWTEAIFKSLTKRTFNSFTDLELITDKLKVLFLRRPGKGIDDLPEELWGRILKNHVVVVDTHSEEKREEFTDQEISDLIRNLERNVGETDGEPEGKLRIGYGEAKVGPDCLTLCHNVVKALTFEINGKKVTIVYLYANNAQPGLGEEISEWTKDLTGETILVTPDDHSCTASSLSSLYYPAAPCKSMREAVTEAVKRSLSSMSYAKISFNIITVKHVKVLGKIVSILVEGLEIVGRKTLRTVWIPLASPLVLLPLFLILQNLLNSISVFRV